MSAQSDIKDSVEERVARYLAGLDWLGKETVSDRWWSSRTEKFRRDYLAHAGRIVGIVRGSEAQ